MIRRLISCVAAILVVPACATARDKYIYPSHKGIEYSVTAGANIGATTPMGLPAEIRKINSYKPTLNLSLGASALRMLDNHWGISAGVLLENKGMETGVNVRNYHLTMNVVSGSSTGRKTGYYTGSIKNKTKIAYVTVPVTAVWRPDQFWQVNAGMYFAYAVDRTFTGNVYEGSLREDPHHPVQAVERAEYDYSSDIRRFDTGFQAGVSRRIYRSLAVRADLKWGVVSTLPESVRKIDMNTYNVYLNIALTYTI